MTKTYCVNFQETHKVYDQRGECVLSLPLSPAKLKTTPASKVEGETLARNVISRGCYIHILLMMALHLMWWWFDTSVVLLQKNPFLSSSCFLFSLPSPSYHHTILMYNIVYHYIIYRSTCRAVTPIFLLPTISFLSLFIKKWSCVSEFALGLTFKKACLPYSIHPSLQIPS